MLLGERAAVRGLALRYVPVTGAHGPAAARNAGWRAARGPIIAFTDDDCLPTKDWLAAGVAAFVDGIAAWRAVSSCRCREGPRTTNAIPRRSSRPSL